jgi:uncharacterized coiled-coil protein SlyX
MGLIDRARAGATYVADRVSPTYLIAPWALMDRLRSAVARLYTRADLQDARLTRLEKRMATDRDLIERLAAALPVIADGIRAKDARIAELEGNAAGDEAADTAALSPVADAVDALVAAVSPAAPDVTPVENVEDVPASVDGVVGEPLLASDGADSTSSADSQF